MTEKELQEKILTYRLLEARLDGLVKQRDMLINKVIELQSTLGSIDELSKSDGEVIFPIGGETYRIAKAVDKDKLLVEIGAGVALEKDTAEGKGILNKRKDELEKFVNQLQQEILKVSDAMSQLNPEIQKLAKDVQQAG